MGRQPRLSQAAGIAFAVVLACAACGRSRPPAKLANRTPGAPIPAVLEHLGDAAILSTERTLTPRALDSRGHECVARATGQSLPRDQVLVERVDHLGSSLTFRPRGGPFVIGCTSAGGGSESGGDWCGHMVGEIRNGHLLDPRLDIACRTAGGKAIGSAWIEPVAHAKWIVVRDRGLTQVYPTATSLPVRVTTLSADLPTATAVFRVEQYDAAGTRVSEATVRTAVAG